MAAREFRVDLHVHASGSPDSEADPRECIERAIESGLSGIAFTEHHFYCASEYVEPLRNCYAGQIQLLRGVEFSTVEGHCLVYGVDTDELFGEGSDRLLGYAPGVEAQVLIHEVNRAGGVVVPSHPFRSGSGLRDLAFSLPGIVAVEGCNGYNPSAYNERAIMEAGKRELPFTGGSDAHLAHEVGNCYTVFSEPVTPDNLVQLLKGGDFWGVDARPKYSRGLFGGWE